MSCLFLVRTRFPLLLFFFFFNDTATTEIYTLSLHDALPISAPAPACFGTLNVLPLMVTCEARTSPRSEEHTSELQSRQYLVCRLLLEKKKKSRSKRVLTHEPAPLHCPPTRLQEGS